MIEMHQEKDLIYEELANVVGEEWVSNEPEICIAYSKDISTPSFTPSRSPFYVVLPSSTEEVQKIVIIARRYKLPITVQTTGGNVVGICVPTMGGILIDLTRMDRIIEIDEEHLTATVQPGVTFARLSTELQKRGMWVPCMGGPSTLSILSNYVSFGIHKQGVRTGGRGYRNIVGYELVLPNGEILRIGSGSDLRKENIWPHGPGPDLSTLPVYCFGSFGVVTSLTVKCWPLEEELKCFWISFRSIDDLIPALQEIARYDLAKGLVFYGSGSYVPYATDTAEATDRMLRAHPPFVIVMSLEGTKRRVEYCEKAVRRIAKKYGGRIIADKIPPYQIWVDSHKAMTAGFFSDFCNRNWRAGGRGQSFYLPGIGGIDQAPDSFRAYYSVLEEDPDYFDPEFMGQPNARFWFSFLSSIADAGHWSTFEHDVYAHPYHPDHVAMVRRMSPKFAKRLAKEGIAAPGLSFTPRTGVPNIYGNYMEVSKKLKELLDPDGIMSPGILFP